MSLEPTRSFPSAGQLWPVVITGAALTILANLFWPAAVWVFKPLTTLAILVAAHLGRRRHPAYAYPLVGGLLCSLAGDVALIRPDLFVVGLLAFLVAHLFYLWAFTREVALAEKLWPFGVVAVIAATMLTVLWPVLPEPLRFPVLGYVVMLGMMTAQAITRDKVLGTAASKKAALGGILFMLSDALLAINHFHTGIPLAALWVLATYYAAQTFIALSIDRQQSY